MTAITRQPIHDRLDPRIVAASCDVAGQRAKITAFDVGVAGSTAASELLGEKVFGEPSRVKEAAPHHTSQNESVLQLWS